MIQIFQMDSDDEEMMSTHPYEESAMIASSSHEPRSGGVCMTPKIYLPNLMVRLDWPC